MNTSCPKICTPTLIIKLQYHVEYIKKYFINITYHKDHIINMPNSTSVVTFQCLESPFSNLITVSQPDLKTTKMYF